MMIALQIVSLLAGTFFLFLIGFSCGRVSAGREVSTRLEEAFQKGTALGWVLSSSGAIPPEGPVLAYVEEIKEAMLADAVDNLRVMPEGEA